MSSVNIYKPRARGDGHAAQFNYNAGSERVDPCVYINIVKQSSWDAESKVGKFYKTGEDSKTSVSIKISAWEIGSLIRAIDTDGAFSTVHVFKESKTSIKFAMFDRPPTDKFPASKSWGLSITRDDVPFRIAIEMNEAVVIRQFLINSLDKLIESNAV